MLVFIDESGDAGFKIGKGSSSNFVVALVIFDDELDAEETALTIKKLRKTLQKSDAFEFKFNKCNKELRFAFLKAVRGCKFRIRATVFPKDIIYGVEHRTSKNSFYNFALMNALRHNDDSISQAKIKLDGSGDNTFKQNLTNYLRNHLNADDKNIMQNLKFHDSRKNVLIQLADMVAGSIRKSYDKDAKDSEIYRKLLRAREENVRVLK